MGGVTVIEDASAALVLTAQSFNPSIITDTWLQHRSILSLDDLVGARVFSPDVTQFQTDQFQVLVILPKMQITFSTHNVENCIDGPRNVVTKIVKLLPHTPYKALGINFNYKISQPEKQDYATFNRALFGQGSCPLLDEFKEADARFGRYLSKNYGSARLRLDIKPIKPKPEKREFLSFDFNFHHDLEETARDTLPQEITRLLNTWDSLREYSETLVKICSDSQG